MNTTTTFVLLFLVVLLMYELYERNTGDWGKLFDRLVRLLMMYAFAIFLLFVFFAHQYRKIFKKRG